jgi:hypothetical protein
MTFPAAPFSFFSTGVPAADRRVCFPAATCPWQRRWHEGAAGGMSSMKLSKLLAMPAAQLLDFQKFETTGN